MRNFSIIAKGKYSHKQTSELLEVTRYLIIRKKRGRVLLLDLNNHSEEKLTAMQLLIEQFDARENSLGETTVKLENLSVGKGEFVLKKEIAVHRSCIDFRVKVLAVEYGNYVYRLGGADTFVTYEKPVVRKPVDKKKMRKKLGNRNFLAKRRKYSIPLFVSAFVALLLLIPPVITFSQTQIFDNNGESQFHLKNVTYEFTEADYNDKTPVNVIGYDGVGGQNIVIPATLDGHPVKAVKAEAFKQNLIIETLTVESGVIIEDRAFAECPFLKKVVLKGTANVGAEAFYNCDSLTSVQGENVAQIGDKAFYDCSALKSVRIVSNKDEGAMTLGEKAFGRCGSFDEIYIKRFINYGENCDYFYSSFKVDSLYLQNYNYTPYEKNENGSKPLNALFGGMDSDVKTVQIAYTDEIPADFTKGCNDVLQRVKIGSMESKEIGDRAFLKCKALSTVEFPVTITSVGESAFEECALKNFDFSATTAMGVNAFKDCAQLKEIKLSASLKNIPVYAFNGCKALTSVTIPQGVVSIGTGAFKDCTNVEKVTFDGNSKLSVIMTEAFAGLRKIRRVDLPQKLEKVSEKAFADCRSVRYLTIPESMQTMEKDSFENCYKLYEIENYGQEYIRIGSGIGKYAFKVYTSKDDARLEKVTQNGFVLAQRYNDWYVIDYTGKGGAVSMPTNAKITSYAVVPHLFGENTNVTKVNIPACVTDMGDGMFLDSVVEDVYFESRSGGVGLTSQTFAGATSLKNVDMSVCCTGMMYNPMTLPDKVFADCSNLKTVKFFNGLQKISAGAFLHCKNLENVYGCNQVITIGESAFKECSKLQSVDISSRLQAIGNRAFYDCSALKIDDSYVLNGVRTVGDEAFKYCEKLTNVQFSWLFKELGESAFEGCASLRSVYLNGDLEEIKANTFSGCMQLRDLSINSSVKSIGEKAFYNCIRLESVSLPSDLETIGASAFRNNKALREVTFTGRQVFSIGDKAFYKNNALTSVYDLHGNIGVSVFEGCENLTSIAIRNTQNSQADQGFGEYRTAIAERAFYGCKSLESVEIPENVTAIGQGAFEGCPILHEVINRSELSIEKDSVEHGMIGYNALVVTKNDYNRLNKSNYGNFQFKYNWNYMFLTDYTGNEKQIVLGTTVSEGDQRYSVSRSYEIARYAFENHDGIERITLDDGANSIRTEAFCNLKNLKELRLLNESGLTLKTNTFTNCEQLRNVLIGVNFAEIDSYALGVNGVSVYYEGSQSDWYSNSSNYNLGAYEVRYYKNQYGIHECVHPHNAMQYWQYDDKGNINTEVKQYSSYVAKEPTCRENGIQVYYCNNCPYTREETLYPYGHYYEKGECVHCGHIKDLQITPNSMSKAENLVNITLSGDPTFSLSQEGVYQTSTAMEVGDAAELIIVAKEDISISFLCSTSSTTGTLTVITKTSEQTISYNRNLNYSLSAGQYVRIRYVKERKLDEKEEAGLESLQFARIYNIRLTQKNYPD